MAAHDAHVCAFVQHWAPEEVEEIMHRHWLWVAELTSSLRMVARCPQRWMLILGCWLGDSAPSLTGPLIVRCARANREEWRFDYMRENHITSVDGYTQHEWDSMMP